MYRGCLLHFIARDNGRNVLRVAVAASKKIGNAVKRNRVRRLVFQGFSEMRPSLAKMIDVVAYPKVAAVGIGLDRVKAEIKEFFEEAGLIIND